MMRVILSLCTGLLLNGAVFGQLSLEKLDKVTEYLQAEVDAKRVAGAVGLIARHGEIGYFAAVGDGMEKEALFRIASMTKAVTSVAVMMLVEEGEIALTDPIEKHLPEFAKETRKPTIHHLLTHTSGVGYGWFGPDSQDEAYRETQVNDLLIPAKDTIAERVATLGPLPLAFDPGEQWAYGMSTDVLGRLVEVISGLTLEQFFQERIFRPLKMQDTHFYLPQEKMNRLAPLFTPSDDKSTLLPVGSEVLEAGAIKFSADYCYEGKGNLFAGGSGLVSSTYDYFTFLQNLLDGGGELLKPSTVAQMTQNQIGDLSIPFPGHGDGFGYGFGVLTERGMADDVTRVGTYSWGGIFNTYYWVDPQEDMVGILMTQVFPNDHLSIRHGFKELAYKALDDSGFYREYWYEQGVEHGNPFFNDRQLRVNAPEVSTHETYSQRSEPQSSGMARILIKEDLRKVRRADLYTEIWGGHPGTANKRVNVNGRHAFTIPEVGTESYHCTHQYPSFHLSPNDLVNGYNALQFACDQGTTFWGHYIVDNACLRIGLGKAFGSSEVLHVQVEDNFVGLSMPSAEFDGDVTVHYQARYYGYDENGNGYATDWHGMTKNRQPYGMLGSADEPPYGVVWDTSMLPNQTNVAVKAMVRSKGHPEVVIEMPIVDGIAFKDRKVFIHHVDKLPTPFWSRDGKPLNASIPLEIDPNDIDKAELHVVTWTGGPGEVKDYFTLNGHHLPVADGHDHEVHYVTMPIDPKLLVKGDNKIVLLSDTKHHGIEILRPGPALVVRAKSP